MIKQLRVALDHTTSKLSYAKGRIYLTRLIGMA